MTFGEAIEAMRNGVKVQRRGWNGKGMFIYLEDQIGSGMRFNAHKYDPCIIMFTAHGTHQPGWLASQADMLAEDWEIVE